MSLTGKIVLVTGGSHGIGAAVASEFGRSMATVVVHFRRDRHRAERVIEQLPKGRHSVVQADLANPSAAQYVIETVVQDHGGIDILVNNAGVDRPQNILEVSYDDWEDVWNETLATNLLAPANLMFHAARFMAVNGGGRIINISSRGAFRGEPNSPAYGASKAGLNSLGQSLAQALASKGVYVTTIAPGFVETEMTRSLLDGPNGRQYRDQSPLKRAGSADEIARLVAFLGTEGTDYMTGAIIDINGASYLRT